MTNPAFKEGRREGAADTGRRPITELSEEALDRLVYLGAKAALVGLTGDEHLEYGLAFRGIEPLPLDGAGSSGAPPSREEEFEMVREIIRNGGLEIPDQNLWEFILSTSDDYSAKGE